mmetsp:Transcript_43222/g.116948  ORF Transcript_43222/g.116948 Transcript_43222/m.116948 type:complete len:240 (+) Transcript_43222:826-1545(+)
MAAVFCYSDTLGQERIEVSATCPCMYQEWSWQVAVAVLSGLAYLGYFVIVSVVAQCQCLNRPRVQKNAVMVKGRVVEELTRVLDHRITFLTSLLALLCLMISMSILSDYHYRYNECDVGGEEESEAESGRSYASRENSPSYHAGVALSVLSFGSFALGQFIRMVEAVKVGALKYQLVGGEGKSRPANSLDPAAALLCADPFAPVLLNVKEQAQVRPKDVKMLALPTEVRTVRCWGVRLN